VIGKEFSQPVLERVLKLESQQLDQALGKLVAGEFVYERELYPEALYAFKHPLTQEVAYGSQLGERRAPIHAAVARAIAACYRERLEERAALLAQHWEAAGETLEAARWHARAAAWAGRNPAEALRHWRRGRKLAGALGESAETTALGIAARTYLLNYGWRLGISHEEAEATFDEAERMAAEAGDVRSRALLLFSYGVLKGVGERDLRAWARLIRQSLALAEESGDRGLYIMSATGAHSLFYTGGLREAVAILDRAIELGAGDPTLGAGVAVGCPYAVCLVFKGLALVHLGELEEARRLLEREMKIAREQGDSETVGWGHGFSTWLAYVVGEPEGALGHAQQALEIAERIGDSLSRTSAWLWLGVAENMRGRWREAIDAIERSTAIARERRTAGLMEPNLLVHLGESYLGLGDVERARGLVEQAIEDARVRGDLFIETYANIVLARVLLASAGPNARAETEAALARALELARETEMKSQEPMIHVELAELARQSGEQENRQRELREAHRLFSEIGATGHAERLTGELAMPAS
jgi:tetratricopeptide (TPR) repeat protein